MKIIVTVKAVPEKIKFDKETKRIVRNGIKTVLNPTDLIAAEEARKFKTNSDTFVAISMGPPSSKSALKELFKFGFDEVYLVSDIAFAGSDTFATAYVLSETIKKFVPDFGVIFQGDYSVDGATGQLPGELAALLGIPFLSHIKSVNRSEIVRKREDSIEYFKFVSPILLSVSDDANFGISPNLFYIKSAEQREVQTITNNELRIDPSLCGLKGSKTAVLSVVQNEIPESRGMITENGAKKIAELLKKAGVI